MSNETHRRPRLSLVRTALEALFDHYARPGAVVDVLVAKDETLRRLNRDHRGQDEATDVLTFPGPGTPGAPLGDIAVAIGFAERGAARRKVPLSEEVAFLALHGGLHLLGFDDETETDRDDMVARMNEVARLAGLRPDEDWASLPHGLDDRGQ